MKKFITILLVTILSLGVLVGCSSSDKVETPEGAVLYSNGGPVEFFEHRG